MIGPGAPSTMATGPVPFRMISASTDDDDDGAAPARHHQDAAGDAAPEFGMSVIDDLPGFRNRHRRKNRVARKEPPPSLWRHPRRETTGFDHIAPSPRAPGQPIARSQRSCRTRPRTRDCLARSTPTSPELVMMTPFRSCRIEVHVCTGVRYRLEAEAVHAGEKTILLQPLQRRSASVHVDRDVTAGSDLAETRAVAPIQGERSEGVPRQTATISAPSATVDRCRSAVSTSAGVISNALRAAGPGMRLRSRAPRA